MKLSKLNLLPVPSKQFISSRFNFKLGGTAFKFLPFRVISNFVSECLKSDIAPILYIHPYELFDDFSFYVDSKQLSELSFLKKNYWLIRQYQWHKLGNREVILKLNKIFNSYSSGGTINQLTN